MSSDIPARLAAATGPGPRLELEILIELDLVRRSQTPAGKWWLHHKAGSRWVGYHGHMDDWRDGEPPGYACYRVMSSLDAAVALVERALPGAACSIGWDDDGAEAKIYIPGSLRMIKEHAPTRPLALLLALFMALEAKAALTAPTPRRLHHIRTRRRRMDLCLKRPTAHRALDRDAAADEHPVRPEASDEPGQVDVPEAMLRTPAGKAVASSGEGTESVECDGHAAG